LGGIGTDGGGVCLGGGGHWGISPRCAGDARQNGAGEGVGSWDQKEARREEGGKGEKENDENGPDGAEVDACSAIKKGRHREPK